MKSRGNHKCAFCSDQLNFVTNFVGKYFCDPLVRSSHR